MNELDVAIIGAGPYGLSTAAYLRQSGVGFQVFGNPMQTWLTQMPRGMRLKSEGFASTLYDPQSSFTLQKYCEERGLEYADLGYPIPLDTFSSYGMEFQRRMVPDLHNCQVASLERTATGFRLGLDNGETVAARKVVAAVGISHYKYLPPELSGLPAEKVTHTSDHTTFERFAGKDVLVVGGGSSAVDVAAALLASGANAQLVARDPVIRFHSPLNLPRPWLERLQAPMTGLGPGWRSLLCTDAPLLFRVMPEAFRLKVVRKHLGPAPGWFVRDQVEGRMPFHLGWNLGQAKVAGGRVELRAAKATGESKTFTADHLIAGTGYRVALTRLAFLQPALLAQIRSVEDTPILSSNFESSVPGLYFVGATSANSFGPLARFAYGAGFTSKRLSRHLASLPRRSRVPGVAVRDLKAI
jgi:thioredoxin reductase